MQMSISKYGNYKRGCISIYIEISVDSEDGGRERRAHGTRELLSFKIVNEMLKMRVILEVLTC